MRSQTQSLPYSSYTTAEIASLILADYEEGYIIYNSDTNSHWKKQSSSWIPYNAILQDKNNDTTLSVDNNNDGLNDYVLLSSNHMSGTTIFKINNGGSDIYEMNDDGHLTKVLYLDNNEQIDSNYSIKFNYSSSFSSISALKETTNTDMGFAFGSNATYFGQQFLRYRWNGSLQNNISNSLNPLHFKASGLSRYVGGWDVSSNSGSSIITRTTSGGISFLEECLVNDVVTINGTNYTIQSVDSASQITLTTSFPTTGTYRITFPTRELLMANNLGYVGIGTNNPTNKLEVSGSLNLLSGFTYKINNIDILSSSFVTVGSSGASYLTIYDALTAGKYNWKLVTNVTLDADVTISANKNVKLDLQGYNLDCTTYNFTIGSGESLFITGNYNNVSPYTDRGKITFAYGSTKTLFNAIGNNLIVENIYIDNNSTANECYIANGGCFDKCYFDIPNYSKCGLYTNELYLLHNSIINGGGVNCINTIFNNTVGLNGEDVKDLTFTGTFGSTLFLSYNGYYNNIKYNSSSVSSISCNVIDLLKDTGRKLTLNLIGSGVRFFSNIHCLALNTNGGSGQGNNINLSGALTLNATTNCIINNIICASSDIVSTSSNNILNEIICSGDVIVSGDNNTISESTIAGNLTIEATADSTILDNCRIIGTYTNSGTNTKLINSGQQNELDNSLNLPVGFTYKINNVDILVQNQTTVGTTGQYLTIEDALTANKYNLKLISNITLTQDINLNNKHLKITQDNLHEFYIDFATFRIVQDVYNVNAIVDLENIWFKQGVTASGTYLFNRTNLKIRNCKFTSLVAGGWNAGQISVNTIDIDGLILELPNLANTLFYVCGGIYKNITITGAGTNCWSIWSGQNGRLSIFENIYSTSTFSGNPVFYNTNGYYSEIYMPNAAIANTSTSVNYYNNVNVKYIWENNATHFVTNFTLSGIYGSNAGNGIMYFTNGTITTGTTISSNQTPTYKFNQVKFNQAITIDTTITNVVFNDCSFLGNLTNNGDNNTISESTIAGNLTIKATAANTNVTGARVTGTFVNSGDKSTIIGCRSTASIDDTLGTNTILLANQLL